MSIVLSPSGTGKTIWLNNTNTLFEDADIVLSKYHNCNFERENHTEKIREESVFSPNEKYQYLLKINPALEKLRTTFDLDF